MLLLSDEVSQKIIMELGIAFGHDFMNLFVNKLILFIAQNSFQLGIAILDDSYSILACLKSDVS
jgi:hypothetical protein